MQKLVDVSADPIRGVLNVLLEDKTTGQNVVWGTDAYASKGSGYDAASEIKADALLRESRVVLQPRTEKDVEEQQERTKKRAEVYTPSWLCNKMNNYCDEVCFGRKKVFNVENDDQTWTPVDQPVYFVDKNKRRKIKDWQLYVDSRRLEITCGEAPFLVSRYDAATGELLPLKKRIGILDRKLRVVDENAKTENEWLKWAQRAVESCYGYEYQGDSLLIARINVLLTFYDYYEKRWGKPPTKSLIKKIANIVAWNIWQMDGINDVVPMTRIELQRSSMPLIEFSDPEFLLEESSENFLETPSKIKNWRSRKSFEFKKLKEAGFMKKKMFDFVIGNPPYQGTNESNGRQPPVYHEFMEASFPIGEVVELITPARFLFRAGQTPKAWNEKMLSDEHFKVLFYEPEAVKLFNNTEIKGGVAISYHDYSKKIGPIGVFTQYESLNHIMRKVSEKENRIERFDSIIASQGLYRFSDLLLNTYSSILNSINSGTGSKIVSYFVEQMTEIFLDKPKDGSAYVKILAKGKRGRVVKYIKREYIQENEYIDSYNVMLPESNGSGAFEPLSAPLVAEPLMVSADTFINIGTFDEENHAEAVLRYVKTKFARALLGVKKVTQHNPKATWAYVPLQDFTSNSDINWTQSIAEIDQQLYKKYGLSQEEIDFIETHVKEMN